MEAFVYCWTDHLTNKLYVGSHKGSTEDGYICSSKYMMEEYNKRPGDFTRQIVAEGTFDDIRVLEEKILKSADVKNDDHYYNMHNGNGKFYLKHVTDEHKRKLSIANIGKKIAPRREETKQKMRKPKSDAYRAKFLGNKNAAGVVRSAETIEKTAKSNTGKKRSIETINNLTIAQIKRYQDPTQREIQSAAVTKGWVTRRAKHDNK